jgi:hypothetical protein
VQYGSWRHEPSYGYVWYPRVDVGWRPYYYGRWARLRPWGWTWVAGDPWGWPTHHYGRWGFSAGAWFWIPGGHWGPAWVSWAYAPGYVSWCPLGWNNRPVFYFNASYGRHYDHWRAWTVVPHRRFGTGHVNAHVVNGTHIDARTRGAFVVRTAGPDVQGYAVPRSGAPISVAGGRVPRGGATGSPASASTSPRSTAPDAGAAFRSRRAASEPRSGPGLPAPAREPRSSAAIRTTPNADGSARPSAAGPGQPGTVRRVEPRSGVPVSPSRSYESPSRRRAPESRATPSAPGAGGDGNVTPYNAPDRYRAVPRSEDRYRAVPPSSSSPQPDYGRRAPDYGRRAPSEPSSSSVPRAVPRSPGSDGGPRSYRSAPGNDRAPSNARPSGPPPSAAPSRPSGPPSAAPPSNRGGSSGGARSRGGQPSGGTAVRRPRG